MPSPELQSPRGIFAMRGLSANMFSDVLLLPMSAVSSVGAHVIPMVTL